MLKRHRERLPEGNTVMVGATEEMVRTFRGSATGWRTGGGGALREIILLLLERKEVVNPFYHEETFQEAELQGAAMKGFPVDGIKHRDVRPMMVSPKVDLVGGQSAETAELSREVVGDRDSPNGETTDTSG
jgi:hypothetical protein